MEEFVSPFPEDQDTVEMREMLDNVGAKQPTEFTFDKEDDEN